MAFPSGYHADSDADDEYERSLMTSPVLPTDDDTSATDSDGASTEHTPTTFDTPDNDKSTPRTIISEWTTEECAKFITQLGLQQYCSAFLDNEIVGEALVALRHDELKEMGIASAGHRLTILKGVYDMKIKQDIPIEVDDYVPPSADSSLNNKKATQEDISRIIQSIKIRDDRLLQYEAELKRLSEEYRRLREELLPVFRMAKERSQPLPSPYQPSSPDLYSHDNLASPVLQQPPRDKIGRRNSQKNKGFWPNPTPKNASPTYPEQGKMPSDVSSLDPSAAAMAASSHLTASMTGGAPSPNPGTLPSPTSPNNYATQQTTSRVYNNPSAPSTGSSYSYDPYPSSNASTLVNDSASTFRSNVAPTPGRVRANTRDADDSPSSGGAGAPSVEIFKSFRVSMEDPCHKVLPAALKKYNIQADWRQYALYIVYGDQERCLGLDEKPLILFKQLDKEGRKPMFMLRRHAPPSEGHSGPSGMMGFDGGLGQRAHQSSIQLPGGVL